MDKTEILIDRIALQAGLTEEQARMVADRMQANTDAVKRFEALEAEIVTAKKSVKWLAGLLLANYSSNILDWLTR